MIDPYRITDFARTDPELQELWIFCVSVAGKKATMIAAMVEDFLAGCGHQGSPFEKIRRMIAEDSLGRHLRRARLGKYGVLERAMRMTVSDGGPDLRTASPQELEKIPGVGPKTARFFILHSRPDAKVAVIDTHMLKFLRSRGFSVPDGVPTGRRYAECEKIVIAEAEASGLTAADFDLAVWSHYASGGNSPLPEGCKDSRLYLAPDLSESLVCP